MPMVNVAAPEWRALCDECPARSKQRANESDVPRDWKGRMGFLRCTDCERSYQEAIVKERAAVDAIHVQG